MNAVLVPTQNLPATIAERAVIALGVTAEKERELVELAAGSKAITVITNQDGRQQCHAARMVLKSERVDLEKKGKSARDEATKFNKAVIALEGRLVAILRPEEERLQGIQDAWDAERERERLAKEELERSRIAEIHKRLAILESTPERFTDAPAAKLAEVIASLESGLGFDYQEFTKYAESMRQTVLTVLQKMHADAVEHERAEAEFRAQQLADAARLAAEREQQEAEAKAAREAQERKLADAREELAQLRAQQEKFAAAERARLEEEGRVAREARAVEDARLAAERQAEAARIAAQRALDEAELQAKRDEQAAVERAQQALRDAEQAKLAVERAELDRQRQEIEARERTQREADERQAREVEEKQAAQERRAAMFAREVPSCGEIANAVAESFGVDVDVASKWIVSRTQEQWAAGLAVYLIESAA